MAFTTLERQILKISGVQVGAGGKIAAGTSVTSAKLTTIDEDSGPLGPLNLNPDPYTFNSTEAVSILINGQKVGSALPALYATSITTNAGTFTVLAFTAGNDTYLIPLGQANLSAVTAISSTATLNSVPATSITTADFGFLPENAATFTGSAFTTSQAFGTTAVSVTAAKIFDSDRTRGNADSAGEEFGTGALSRIGEGKEVSAVLQFKDGSSLSGVEAVVSVVNFSYGQVNSTFLFNAADLAAAGKTLNDVASVVSTTAINHALNWEELGFTFQGGGGGTPTPDPAPSPPINQIFGTNANNTITGTAARDAIHGLGGNDTMQGAAGNDGFLFGAETVNGKRETDVIRNYEAGKDDIYFENAAVVRDVVNINGGVRITFAGDGDKVDVLGAGVNIYTVGIYADDFLV